MPDDVIHTFLGNPEKGGGKGMWKGGQLIRKIQLNLNTCFFQICLGIPTDGRKKAQIVKDSGTQVVYDAAQTVQAVCSHLAYGSKPIQQVSTFYGDLVLQSLQL